VSIVNRRNAVLGWAAWEVAKRVAASKAKAAARADESRRPGKGAVVAALAAVGGALWFWRRRPGGDEAE
jgi:hypothetical protein